LAFGSTICYQDTGQPDNWAPPPGLLERRTGDIHCWRDKREHEFDFVLQQRGKPPIAIECKS
jgi:hypothetical protein